MTTLLIALLASSADAADRQFRHLKLADGRELTVEVLSTEPTGLLVQVPSGTMLVSFELLVDMVPVDQAAYDNQARWVVYVDLPDAHQREALELLGAIPNLAAFGLTEPAGGVTAAMVAKAASCERDVDCVARAFAGTPSKSLVTGQPLAEGGLTLFGKVSTSAERPEQVPVAVVDRQSLWAGLHDALGLEPPASGPPKGTTSDRPAPSAGKAFDEKRVVALSFVPIPGLPSLAQDDPAGFALALGVVAPSTALWVGAVGQTGQSAPEFVALSVGGYYAVTVLANQVAGFRSLERKTRISVSAAPSAGGATLSIAGEL